ncbi:hypothetical protein LSH36_486g05010 [Paralvinella palmiformis]|uniref:Glycosyltransferase 61 catalytic domain-containing protein n=1 Tax=Paralvinella palmiformis TaxID=53620 RepID=A0AAD9J931_9ANNE|nr:hypothetical protein LSH36_486g05010 [Paralvinella palmiformis]
MILITILGWQMLSYPTDTPRLKDEESRIESLPFVLKLNVVDSSELLLTTPSTNRKESFDRSLTGSILNDDHRNRTVDLITKPLPNEPKEDVLRGDLQRTHRSVIGAPHYVAFDPTTKPEDPLPTNSSGIDDAERRLRTIGMAIAPYLRSLALSGERYKNRSYPTQLEVCTEAVISRIASAMFDDYFDLFGKYLNDSTTLILEVPSRIFGDGLLEDYYHPSSNNCTLMHSNTKMERDNDYGCDQDVERTFRPIPAEPRDFTSVFPRHFQTTASHRTRVRLIYIHVISGGVVNEMGDVISKNGIVQVKRCFNLDSNNTNRCPSIENLDKVDEVFVIDAFPEDNYYHTNAEGVSRLAPYVGFLKRNPQIKIHAGDYFSFLSFLDIPKDRLVSGSIVARVIYLPSGTTCSVIGLMPGQMLSINLQKGLSNQELPRNVIILIKRSARRYFNYHDDILAMLKNYTDRIGLTVLVFRDDPLPSLDQTRRMFYRALIVIAPHGAGQTNLMFSQPGTVLIEGLCPHKMEKEYNFWNIGYLHVTKRLGMRYYALAYPHFCQLLQLQLFLFKLFRCSPFRRAENTDRAIDPDPEDLTLYER